MSVLTKQYAHSRFYNIDSIIRYKKTEHYSALIKCIARLTNCQSYLELGVWQGDSIREVKNIVPKCVGVDILDCNDKTGFDFYLMTTDDYFAQNKDKFDIIFIDGSHKFEQVKKDFDNSLQVLNQYGIIIMHDTDPMVEDLLADYHCGDAYKINDYILSIEGLSLITLPIQETGISLVMRTNDRRVNKFL